MADNRYRVGDKFIIEIGSGYWNPAIGNRYLIKGFDTLCFDDKGLGRLEKYEEPKEPEHSCEFCYYQDFDEKAYPCSLCDKGIFRDDKFRAR